MIDNPHVRDSLVCPLCHANKNPGLIACWPCYRSHGMKYGNPQAERIVAAAEATLAKVFA